MDGPEFEGDEAFDVEQAHADCLIYTQIEAAAKAKDTLAYLYLLDLQSKAKEATEALMIVDADDRKTIASLQEKTRRYLHFCNWIAQKLQLGQEAANRLATFLPQENVTPTFADHDEPKEADNGNEDD